MRRTKAKISDDRFTNGKIPFPLNVMCVLFGNEDTDRALDTITAAGIFRIMDEALNDKEKEIIYLRYKEMLPLEGVAEQIGVSRERIRQIEAKAMRKMRHPSFLNKNKVISYPEYISVVREKENAENKLEEVLRHVASSIDVLRDTREESILSAADKMIYLEKISLESMELSVRSYNALSNYGCRTLRDVLEIKSLEELKAIRNLGSKSAFEIITKVHQLGYKMAWEGLR